MSIWAAPNQLRAAATAGVLVAVLASGLAACGGDDGGSVRDDGTSSSGSGSGSGSGSEAGSSSE